MNNSQRNEVASIYVHIPFCKARCGYCAFCSCTNFSLREAYFETLSNEISKAVVPFGTSIKTLYWGGGTPSAVGIEYLQKLYDALARKFDLSSLEEFTVECNPESATEELLLFLKNIGVNRLSFGLQSVNDATLKKIGRIHGYSDFLKALRIARQLGYFDINADLIVGLPETKDAFYNSVINVANLPLTHVSVYALEIHDENSAFGQLCKSFAYSDDDLSDMYDFALDYLENRGFLRYEVSNFAKKGFESRHNSAYWREKRYFGFGASASGFLQNVRYGNVCDIKKYIESNASLTEYRDEISPDGEMKEYVMLGLRTRDGIDTQSFEEFFGCDFFAKFPGAESLSQKGFLTICGSKVFIPRDKFYVLNSILVELL